MRILIVDDEPVNRMVLSRKLRQWGHDVVEACDGVEAWARMQAEPFRMVVSDWMMPEMDGVELTRRIRGATLPGYVYVLLLTARGGTAALVEGMEAGADDFVVKPFQSEELLARIRAGERVLRLESDLSERSQKLGEAYASAQRDLEAAAVMQKALLPPAALELRSVRPAWRFLPASIVAGDVFNVHAVDEDRTLFYLLDVAGHGVPSAMLSFTLSKLLAPSLGADGLVKRATATPPYWELVPPAEVLRELNRRFLDDTDSLRYFTMIYGIIDARRDVVTFAQGGHPCPLMVRHGNVERVGDTGYPVGMLGSSAFEQQEIPFGPGDKLVLYSDGVTECTSPAREMFRIERLEALLREQSEAPLPEVIAECERALRAWRGSEEFPDDVTILGLERRAA